MLAEVRHVVALDDADYGVVDLPFLARIVLVVSELELLEVRVVGNGQQLEQLPPFRAAGHVVAYHRRRAHDERKLRIVAAHVHVVDHVVEVDLLTVKDVPVTEAVVTQVDIFHRAVNDEVRVGIVVRKPFPQRAGEILETDHLCRNFRIEVADHGLS